MGGLGRHRMIASPFLGEVFSMFRKYSIAALAVVMLLFLVPVSVSAMGPGDNSQGDEHSQAGDHSQGADHRSDRANDKLAENGVPNAGAPDTDGDGIADDVDNCPAISNADQSDRYGSLKGDACEDDSNGDGTLDVNEPHICVSIDAVTIIEVGDPTCFSTQSTGNGPNIAVVHGASYDDETPSARAFNGDNNTALADGDGSSAQAFTGDNNTAIADGLGADARASEGDDNTATATGDHAQAVVVLGDNNTATNCNLNGFNNTTCP